ncbi:MAG: CHAT domain-containing tetratricopeptide repeat protein [Caldilineaceae bacterium]
MQHNIDGQGRTLDGQTFINAFFQALERRALAECELAIEQLRMLSKEQPTYASWTLYFTGILANERDYNWAKAEQIFLQLLQEQLTPTLHGRALMALGRTYAYQGAWLAALQAYEASLATFTADNQMLNQAKALKQMAIMCCRGYIAGEFGISWLHKGEQYCYAALDLLTQGNEATRWLIGSIYSTVGSIKTYLQHWDQALDYYQRDLSICQELDDQHGIGVSYLNLGEIYHRRSQHDWAQALTCYQGALQLLRRFQDRYLEADVLQNMGALYQLMGEKEQALDHYTQAVTVIEDIRTRISTGEARTGFFTTVVETYSRLVTLLIATKATDTAFAMVERARSRTFIEILGGQALRPPSAPAVLLEREQALRDELRTLYQTPDAEAARITANEDELNVTLQEIRLFAAEYADLRTVLPLAHDQVQQLLPANAALLSYFTTDDKLYVFLVTQSALTVHALPFKMKELQRAFDEAGHVVRMNLGADGRLHEPFVLQPLYDRLIRPLLTDLADIETLYIVPHGLLHFVPFHALSYKAASGETRALLDDYQIVYAPSATVLFDYCQNKVSQAPRSLLAVGYNGSDLRHAEAEAEAIAQLVPGAAALIERMATNETIFAQAPQFRWIHFSCHGQFQRQTPLMSHLRLAGEPLYAADVLQRLRLQADLVTLAACETGRNKVLKGDELLGLVRAFIYAGTPSVVVSLWPVDERSTRILMERFYQEILAGHGKAAALRTAQQYVRGLTAAEVTALLTKYGEPNPAEQVARLYNLTHTPHALNTSTLIAPHTQVFAHPYFWAPFVLIGDQVA